MIKLEKKINRKINELIIKRKKKHFVTKIKQTISVDLFSLNLPLKIEFSSFNEFCKFSLLFLCLEKSEEIVMY